MLTIGPWEIFEFTICSNILKKAYFARLLFLLNAMTILPSLMSSQTVGGRVDGMPLLLDELLYVLCIDWSNAK